MATTLDGRTGTAGGDSQWITGHLARAHGHGLRARHDAVMIGVGTALTDAPRLTCRLPGMEDRSPVRIVLDSRLRLPLDSPLVKTAMETETWVICSQGADGQKKQALTDSGATVIEALGPGRPNLTWVAGELARRGLTRVLLEAGGTLTGAFFAAGLADRVAWFRGPSVIGGDGRPAAAAFGIESLDDAPQFVRTGLTQLGADVLETYSRKA
jgi:diaminohydroxyphosphoribosylaminopyrimidine deaminase/5-amino-6-(5-phosphoribosylamino)uracil reductase